MVNVVPKHIFDRLLHVYLQFIYFSSAFQPPGLCTELQPFESLVWRCLELLTLVHTVVFFHIYVVHGGAIWWHVVPVCQGYDSIVFNPGDGNEIVIWDKHRVKSMRRKAAPL